MVKNEMKSVPSKILVLPSLVFWFGLILKHGILGNELGTSKCVLLISSDITSTDTGSQWQTT